MNSFAAATRTLASAPDNFGLRLFERKEVRALGHRALDETGKHEKKHCPLTGIFVLWTVLAMSLDRHLSMANVLKRAFGLANRLCGRPVRRSVTPEAFYRARYRLGDKPLEVFFRGTAEAISQAPSFKGLRVWGIDGCRMNLPDTPENEEFFGRPAASRGSTAFPQMLAVCLVRTDTRQVKDVVIGPCTMAERPACLKVLDNLGKGDVVLMDRGISAVWLWQECLQREEEFLGRISASWKPQILRGLGKGNWLVRINGFILVENEEGEVKQRRTSMVARLIQYQVGRGEVVRLITSLIDHRKFPARELALLYHERWECELAYDELKTHLSTVTHGTLDTIFRSKFPRGVLQETYALLAIYNLIRGLMEEAGDAHGIPSLQLSFVDSVEVIKQSLPEFQSASPRRQKLLYTKLLADIAACKLRPRRNRFYPRKVKQKMSNYGLKRKGDRQKLINYAAELRLYDKPYRT